jgi:hypothetical protein
VTLKRVFRPIFDFFDIVPAAGGYGAVGLHITNVLAVRCNCLFFYYTVVQCSEVQCLGMAAPGTE